MWYPRVLRGASNGGGDVFSNCISGAYLSGELGIRDQFSLGGHTHF